MPSSKANVTRFLFGCDEPCAACGARLFFSNSDHRETPSGFVNPVRRSQFAKIRGHVPKAVRRQPLDSVQEVGVLNCTLTAHQNKAAKTARKRKREIECNES